MTDDLNDTHIKLEVDYPEIADIVLSFGAFLKAIGYHEDTIAYYLKPEDE